MLSMMLCCQRDDDRMRVQELRQRGEYDVISTVQSELQTSRGTNVSAIAHRIILLFLPFLALHWSFVVRWSRLSLEPSFVE